MKRSYGPVGAYLVATVLACSGDEWTGFVYPSSANLTVHREIGVFKSLEACRTSARAYLADLQATDSGDYECGRNCRPDDTLGVSVCEETLR